MSNEDTNLESQNTKVQDQVGLSELDHEADIAADYIEELLVIADIDGDFDLFTESGRAHVSVLTDSRKLVGKDGKVLEALQDLTRLAVLNRTGKRSRLMLDIAGNREERKLQLQALATEAIMEVKDTGQPVKLVPMNAYERKIVHDVVSAAGLASDSEGEDPNRHVVITAS